MTGQTISHFEVLEKIGEGGMGLVYRGRDLMLDRQVALKVLPAEQDRQRRPSASLHPGSQGGLGAQSP